MMTCRSTASRPSLGVRHLPHSAPSQYGWLPTQTMATSAALAIFTAAPPVLSLAYFTFTSSPTLLRIPASGVTVYGGVPLYQSKSTSSARGPITAIDLSLLLSKGKVLFEFFSNTMVFCVTSLAAALCFSLTQGSEVSLTP